MSRPTSNSPAARVPTPGSLVCALVITTLAALVGLVLPPSNVLAAPGDPDGQAGGGGGGVRGLDELDFDDDLELPPVAEPAVPTIGTQLREFRPAEVTESPLVTAPVCDDGTSGPRLQVLYVRTPSQPDTSAANADTFREAIAFGDQLLNESVPGREMHLRLVHSGAPGCVIDVKKVVVPESTLATGPGESVLSKTIRHLQVQPGLQDPNRKYLFFAEIDSGAECGLASHWVDDSPGGGNLNNGIRATHGGIGKRCWNLPYDKTNPNAVAAIHEIFHMFGSVSRDAPHGSAAGHCRDENDLMCYDDGAGVYYACGADPGFSVNNDPNNYLLDCNDDDYFDPSRPVGGFLAGSWNTADSDFIEGNGGDRFVPLSSPRRAYDSRQRSGPVGSGGIVVPLSISPGNPASRPEASVPWDATGVVLNVTAVDPSVQLNLVVWPAGLPQPVASNLNVPPGKVIANQVTVKLGNGGAPFGSGAIAIASNRGAVDVVVDVVGYYQRARPGAAQAFTAVTPYRTLSSRDGIGGYTTKWGPRQTRRVAISGGGRPVPASASAVVLNLTATEGTAPRSHLRAFPAGATLPTASSLNFEAGVNTPNLVTVRLSGGAIDIYNHAGSAHVIADVVGYYGPSGSLFVPVPNTRVLDSRAATKVGSLGRWGAGQQQVLQLTGRASIPANAVGVVLNVTGAGQTRNTYLAVAPAGAPRVAGTSNVNLVGGGAPRPNAVAVGLGSGGKVAIYNHAGSIDVVIDVVGYFVPA
jgi:hypothetical protein